MFQYPIINRLVHPYAPLIILLGLVIARLWWKGMLSRSQRLAITIPYLLLLAMSLPAVSYLAFASLEWPYAPLDHRPAGTDAIVVLSGYVAPPNQQRDYAIPGPDTLARCLHGAALYHRDEPCWVIVSGGKFGSNLPGQTTAEAMKRVLVLQGVQEEFIVLEGRSGNTYENAVESAKLLREREIEEVVLVTDAASLLRAERCFRRQGIHTIPSGCRYRTLGGFPFSLVAFMPSINAAEGVSEAWHEWLGLAWYWFRGRI
jgi:uncharacterized SAM-binding protein YcdF (DUF218 family)